VVVGGGAVDEVRVWWCGGGAGERSEPGGAGAGQCTRVVAEAWRGNTREHFTPREVGANHPAVQRRISFKSSFALHAHAIYVNILT